MSKCNLSRHEAIDRWENCGVISLSSWASSNVKESARRMRLGFNSLTATVIIIVLCVAFVEGCKKHDSEVATVPLVKSIDDEAFDQAWTDFRQYWHQCDNSFLSFVDSSAMTGSHVYEITDARPQLVHFLSDLGTSPNGTLSGADRLNGITWKAIVFFDYEGLRNFDIPSRQWSEWKASDRTGMSQRGCWYREIMKKNGVWTVHPCSMSKAYEDALESRHLIDCQQAKLIYKGEIPSLTSLGKPKSTSAPTSQASELRENPSVLGGTLGLKENEAHLHARGLCRANIRSIVGGFTFYQFSHKGQMPPSLGAVLLDQQVDIDVGAFICPSSGTTVPQEIKGATNEVKAEWVNKHSDYIYLGAGQSNPKYDFVTLYERASNHAAPNGANGGAHIVSGDVVEYYLSEMAEKILGQLKAGQNPPR